MAQTWKLGQNLKMYISDLSEDDIEIAIKVRELLYSQIFSYKRPQPSLGKHSVHLPMLLFLWKSICLKIYSKTIVKFDLG